MKNKQGVWTITLTIIIFLILIVGMLYFLFKFEQEDKTAIEIRVKEKALELYNNEKNLGAEFNSQCLGIIYVNFQSYVVDIVHNPRIEEDDLESNQCEDFLNGEVTRFIELDKDGEVVRIKHE